MDSNLITEGCTVLLQRGSFSRLCKVNTSRIQVLGKKNDKLTLDFSLTTGQPFGTTFSLISVGGSHQKLQPLPCNEIIEDSPETKFDSGIDNRNLLDNNTSQNLTREEILALKSSGASGEDVIQAITANSSTFKTKTKFSQEKYITKKEKKHTQPITLHRPTLDLIADMFFSQEPFKVSQLRSDTLFHLLCLSNVCPGQRAAVFDCDTKFLVTAGLLLRLGRQGRLVHVYSGNKPLTSSSEWTALSGLNLCPEDTRPLSTISINKLHICRPPGSARESESQDELRRNQELEEDVGCDLIAPGKVRSPEVQERVSALVLEGGVSCLAIACRAHPSTPTLALLPFLLPGCPFVVFSPYKEALAELYLELKSRHCTNLRVSETWLREYQVLPERTHPELNMSGGGGYLLSGFKVSSAT